jgi:tetratricopeptide (TPR) repeat protein
MLIFKRALLVSRRSMMMSSSSSSASASVLMTDKQKKRAKLEAQRIFDRANHRLNELVSAPNVDSTESELSARKSELRQVAAEFARTRKLFQEAEDNGGVVKSMMPLGIALREAGDDDAARSVFSSAARHVSDGLNSVPEGGSVDVDTLNRMSGADRSQMSLESSLRGVHVKSIALQVDGQTDKAVHELAKAVEFVEEQSAAGLVNVRSYAMTKVLAPLYEQLGALHARRDDIDAAVRYFEAALALDLDVAAREKMLLYVGEAWEQRGRWPDAIATYERLDAAAEERQRFDARWHALDRIGTAHAEMHRFEASAESHRSALRIAERLENREACKRAEVQSLCALARALCGLDERAEAVEQLQRALAIARDIGDTDLQQSTLVHIGSLLSQTGDGDGAIVNLQVAVTLAADASRPRATALAFLGEAFARSGDLKRACDTLEQAVDVCSKLDAHDIADLECKTLRELGDVLSRLGKPLAALEHLQRSAQLARETNSQVSLLKTLSITVTTLRMLGKEAEARKTLQTVVELDQALSDR